MRAPKSRKGILKRRFTESLCRILIVIKVSGPTGGAGGAGPDMAVDKIADDFDTGTRSLMIDLVHCDS